jgi:uncharacterized protein (DUF433 family)
MKFIHIIVRPTASIGKPCVRDLRFLNAYPYLGPADVDEALHYAGSLAADEAIA